MTLIDSKTELKKYAELYSAEAANGINSTPKYLAFRDLPNLFQKYQVGNNALDLGCGTGYFYHVSKISRF